MFFLTIENIYMFKKIFEKIFLYKRMKILFINKIIINYK